MTPAPPLVHGRVHAHTHTHTPTPLHSGLTPLPRHPGCRDILFPKNRSRGPCFRPGFLTSPSPAAELTPEVVLAEPGWRRPSLGGTTWVPPSPGCLIPTGPPSSHTHTHTHTRTLFFDAPKPIPGAPLPLSYLEFVCSPEFSWACREAVARASWPPQACLGSQLHLLFLLPPCLPRPTQPLPAFPTALEIQFGSFFCIFKDSCPLTPAPPHPYSLTWKEIMYLCLL